MGEVQAKQTMELSNDINVITAEINAYKQVAGEAIFEIGRRLKGVRDNPEKYGLKGYRDWERWCDDELDMTRHTANRFIQAFEQLGTTSYRLPPGKIFEIIALPSEIDRAKFIEKPHTIPSTGETKTVDEMTVRELREVKRKLKEEQEARKRDVARVKMEKERTEQELIRTQQALREMEDDIRSKRTKIDDIEHEKKLLEKRLKAQERDVAEVKRIRSEIERLSLERDDIHRQIESATELSRLYVEIENFLQTKLAPVQYSRALTERRDSEVVMENLRGIVNMVEVWCEEMKSLMPQKNYIDAEVVEYEQ